MHNHTISIPRQDNPCLLYTSLMYLESMVDGAMKGMGEQKAVFRYSLWDAVLRIAGVLLLLPRWGTVSYTHLLLKAQELQDALVDRGVEAQAALVGADGAVELDAVAAVHLDLALIKMCIRDRHTADGNIAAGEQLGVALNADAAAQA